MIAVEPTPAVRAAFERWRLLEAAGHYGQPCPDEVMEGIIDEASQAIRALAAVPATNAADVLLKLLPLALIECDPRLGEPPFQPVVEAPDGEKYQELDLWRGIIADLPVVSAILAETMTLPASGWAIEAAAQRASRGAA